ncbi:hypothetical protein D9758_011274 [Tetrapyrgos nigripes]|uniref:HAT C-terminal dimerisation domain-containing protein n=1 Tax=Tetrapyrgos nigripes TaxID=182062 RepID=A0A8H5CTM1_9AGAR|nr:hypothetical protein D9758_011274 [Tetrapyrgos nigripes]
MLRLNDVFMQGSADVSSSFWQFMNQDVILTVRSSGRQHKRTAEADPDDTSNLSLTSSIVSVVASNITKAVKGASKAVKGTVKKVKKAEKHSCQMAPSPTSSECEPIEVSDDTSSNVEPEHSREENDEDELKQLWAHWTSPIYSFFHEKPTVAYQDNCKYHHFKSKASKCKGKGGVHHYLDGGDHVSTSNLKKHAVSCFGKDAVDAAIKSVAEAALTQNSIFSMFTGLGNHVVSISHRMHTNLEQQQLAVHLQHQGKPLVFLLDIVEVPESHTSLTLAHEFDQMLQHLGLEQKILGVCRDNATSNDTQTTALDASESNLFTVKGHVLLNGISGSFDKGDTVLLNDDIEDDEDDLPPLLDDDILSDNEDEDIDEVSGLDDTAKVTFEKETSEVWVALEKICNKDLPYHKHELTTSEWNILKDLHYVLQIFKDTTVHFSSKQQSSISAVISTMDHIDNLLTAQMVTAPTSGQDADSTQPPLHESVKAALRLAKQLMNQYYSMTDESAIYQIAMGLKLEYFHCHNWKQKRSHVKPTMSILNKLKLNKLCKVNSSTASATATPSASSSFTPSFNDFTNISVASSATVTTHDKLSDYLAMPLENVKDPLLWWLVHSLIPLPGKLEQEDIVDVLLDVEEKKAKKQASSSLQYTVVLQTCGCWVRDFDASTCKSENFATLISSAFPFQEHNLAYLSNAVRFAPQQVARHSQHVRTIAIHVILLV